MDKMEVWEGEVVGLEVSAEELVVAREGKKSGAKFWEYPRRASRTDPDTHSRG
jgi:hypothetical protein